jgi:CIC family chloride channel protein
MLKRLWRRVRAAIDQRGMAIFIGLALVVGVIVGLAAAALIGLLELFSSGVEELGDALGSESLAVLIAVPTGILVAWLIARWFAPDMGSHGVPEAIEDLAIRNGYIATKIAPLKIMATAFTLGGGGSAGREGPIVHIGAAIGSSLSRHTGLGEDRVRSLVAAGAGAAIGASFNAPIAGMLFAMEVILGNFAVRHLNAVVVASVAAAVTTRSIVGEELILRAPPHRFTDARELILYAALGVLVALVGWLFLRFIDIADRVEIRRPAWLRPVGFGLVVAALGILEPDVLGTGLDFMRGLLAKSSSDTLVWGSLLAICALKLIATALTLGSGGSGGFFMPSLFIGSVVGASFAALVGQVWSVSTLEPGAFAVVGMAAAFAVIGRAPLTSILIVFEITQDYGLVLPLMLATSLATFLADRIHPMSVYTMALARRGVRLTRRGEVDLLDTVRAGDVASPSPAVATPDMTLGEMREVFDRTRMHGVPVVTGDDTLVGVITVTDLLRAGDAPAATPVRSVMTPRPVTASESTPVSVVLERMASLGIGRVPVVADQDPTRLVALFRREDAVKAYHQALGQEVHHDLGRSRLQARVASGTDFHDIAVRPGSIADGRLLKEVPLPGGVTIVSVRRGTDVVIPDGNTRLHQGDMLTVFALHGMHEQLVERLRADDTAELEVLVGDDRARFFDIEIPDGSVGAGRSIRELAVPGGCTIVSIRRGDEIIIPRGDTGLEAGDVMTVFAHPGSRRVLAERLIARG